MTKQHKKARREVEEPEVQLEETQSEEVVTLPYYQVKSWKGVCQVFCCDLCSSQHDLEGDAQLHVISHFPPEHQADVLDLILEKE